MLSQESAPKPIVPGQAVRLSDLVVRITAPNAGPLTGPGTNTYLVGKDELTVVDPGPNIDSHVQAILAAGDGKITRIAVTHTHPDHSPAATPLAEATGAMTFGKTIEDDGHQDTTFSPIQVLVNGNSIQTSEYCLEVVYTPGHVGNHFCFILREENMLFAGDHLMQGSTVVIVPPSGDMADYVSSLQTLLHCNIETIAPGHGTLMDGAKKIIERNITHRLMREEKVIAALKKLPDSTIGDLVRSVYSDVDEQLYQLASWSLLAHLLKLEKEGRALQTKLRTSNGEANDSIWRYCG